MFRIEDPQRVERCINKDLKLLVTCTAEIKPSARRKTARQQKIRSIVVNPRVLNSSTCAGESSAENSTRGRRIISSSIVSAMFAPLAAA